MIDVEKTAITAARLSLNEVKLNSRRRDIDTSYIVAINELGKIQDYMLVNFYDRGEIDNVSGIITSISKTNNNIKIYSKPNNYPSEGYVLITDDGYYISTDDSYILKVD